MVRIILPVAEIIREHNSYLNMLSFYDEGLHGVIRDFVLIHSGGHNELQRKRALHVPETALIEKILREYHCSPHAVMCHVSENTDYSTVVEVASESIAQSIAWMMRSLLANGIYDVRKDWHKWVGNDLCVMINMYQ